MKYEVICIIWIPGDKVDSKPVSVHLGLRLLRVILVVDIFLPLRRVVFAWVIILNVCFRLLFDLLAWMVRAIIWQRLSIPVEALVSHEEMQSNTVPHVELVLLEICILLHECQSRRETLGSVHDSVLDVYEAHIEL